MKLITTVCLCLMALTASAQQSGANKYPYQDPSLSAHERAVDLCSRLTLEEKASLMLDESPDIPYELLNEKHLCYDLLYNPDETLFMKNAKAQGATTKNGLEMLLLQAFAGYEIWNS